MSDRWNWMQAQASLHQHAYELLDAHEALLRDANRNRHFFRALQRLVKPGMSVLDIGSGTGVWAITAAALGAGRVVAVERDPLLRGVIRTLARENRVDDRIEVVIGDSREVVLGRKFDLIVSETIGHLGFEEQIVSTLIDARTRFLRPGGILIPRSFAVLAAPAHFSERRPLAAGVPGRFESLEDLMLNIPRWLTATDQIESVARPKELLRVNLGTVEREPDTTNLSACWKLKNSRRVNSFIVWCEFNLSADLRLRTRETTSWLPVVYRIKPFQQTRGRLEFRLSVTSGRDFWSTHLWSAILSAGSSKEVGYYSPANAANVLRILP